MNKQWLIKINEEDNLYYDSEEREYRLRLFCSYCHKPSDCQCYKKYEDYVDDSIEGFPERCCSYLCCLIINSENERENIIRASRKVGIGVKLLDKYTEEDAKLIVEYLVDEGIWDFLDDSSGIQCRILEGNKRTVGM